MNPKYHIIIYTIFPFSFLLELHKADQGIDLYEYFSGESTATRISG
jgi:hypothetical protein